MSWDALAQCVSAHSCEADIALSVVACDGRAWSVRGDELVPAASTAKIPIMVEMFRRIDRAQITLDAPCVVTDLDRAPGSGVLRMLHDGLHLTVGDLLYLMMSISDNTATNMLIESAGMAHINATMRELGMRDSILGRPMVGRLAIAGEQENLATARDYTRLLQAIVAGRAASAQSCKAMLELLSRQHNAHRIGRCVPDAPGYSWGAKNGTNKGIVNEAGFIQTPNGTLLLAVYLQDVADEVLGEAIIADLASQCLRCSGAMHT
jgi:beta-lactamase class A